jgi:hypothetical protein
MSDKAQDPNCPKCDRPESASRWKGGRRLSICGNGHDWDTESRKEQVGKQKAAENSERILTPSYGGFGKW